MTLGQQMASDINDGVGALVEFLLKRDFIIEDSEVNFFKFQW